jgi:hypothetical protein
MRIGTFLLARPLRPVNTTSSTPSGNVDSDSSAAMAANSLV